MARALTPTEREHFDAIRGASNMALVQTQFRGEETAVVTAVTRDGDDYIVTPLAVLLTEDMTKDLVDPSRSADKPSAGYDQSPYPAPASYVPIHSALSYPCERPYQDDCPPDDKPPRYFES
jgi:hypothetical protein